MRVDESVGLWKVGAAGTVEVWEVDMEVGAALKLEVVGAGVVGTLEGAGVVVVDGKAAAVQAETMKEGEGQES